MSAYRQQIAAALAAVAIRDELRYAWLGRVSRRLPDWLHDELSVAERRAFIVQSVAGELYSSFYCRGRVEPARWREPQPVAADPRLLDALLAAKAGRTSEQPLASPGFLTLTGDAGEGTVGDVVRSYWHVTAAGAPELVGALTAELNATQVPYDLKVLTHPLAFDRADPVVLYLGADRFDSVRGALATIATRVSAVLRPPVPAFTLALAPGVGLAEDPGRRISFGQARCALLAEGIVTAHERGLRGRAARGAVVEEHFAHAGVALEAPYREPALAGRHVL